METQTNSRYEIIMGRVIEFSVSTVIASTAMCGILSLTSISYIVGA